MTRINVVPASELAQQHLVAEYRELPRIFNLVRAAIERGESPCDKRNPLAYTLGTGHCRFFYSRLGWLKNRQRDLIREMHDRGYKPSFTDIEDIDTGIPDEWRGDYSPDAAAMAINRARINIRLTEQSARGLAKDGNRFASDSPIVEIVAPER